MAAAAASPPPARARFPRAPVAAAALAAAALWWPSAPWRAAAGPGYQGPALSRGPDAPFRGAERRTLVLLGPIGEGAARRFDAAADGMSPGDVVYVSSPGGLVGQAMLMGSSIRRRGLAVVVGQRPADPAPGRCASSCTLLLAGGVDRTAVPGSAIGVHAVSAVAGDGGGEAGRGRVEAEVASYLAAMGMSPALPALMARHRDVTPLSWSAAATLGLVNRRPL